MWTGPALVVFDLAGTTVEDRGEVPGAFVDAMRDQGIAVEPGVLVQVRGSSKREAIARLVPAGPGRDERIARAFAAFTACLADRYRHEGVHEVPGARATFAWLHARGVHVAFNTGFDRATTDLLLASLGWREGVADAVVCGDDVSRGRPAPFLIFRAMEATGTLRVQDVAVVGDTTLDLEAGHNAGVRWNVGVLSGAHDEARLRAVPHTHLIRDVTGLSALFEEP